MHGYAKVQVFVRHSDWGYENMGQGKQVRITQIHLKIGQSFGGDHLRQWQEVSHSIIDQFFIWVSSFVLL